MTQKKRESLKQLNDLWKDGYIDSQYYNEGVELVNNLVTKMEDADSFSKQEDYKKEIEEYIREGKYTSEGKKKPRQTEYMFDYLNYKKKQRKESYNQWIKKWKKRFRIKTSQKAEQVTPAATPAVETPPVEISQTEAPEQDASSVVETLATEPKPPEVEVSETPAEQAAPASSVAEPAPVNGGSKRRRKYRIKKKSKNTKKRIRFTLKEKTKKNKYLRILKKRNRKKKQQFTNRAMYKRRSLTRCTRKRV